MTLPFADKPEESRVYQDLKELFLSQLNNTQFDQLDQSIKSQGTNGLEDEYRRLVLLKLASEQLTAPAVTGIQTLARVDDTSGTASFDTLFRPAEGETWLLNGAALGAFNAGLCLLYVSAADGTGSMIIGGESTGGSPFNPPPQGPLYVTYDYFLKYETQSVTGDCTIMAYLSRIR